MFYTNVRYVDKCSGYLRTKFAPNIGEEAAVWDELA
jgi:hypothetical protein